MCIRDSDNDGQEGIFIPKSMEVDAAKEVGANMRCV